jgi:hypothetical protein
MIRFPTDRIALLPEKTLRTGMQISFCLLFAGISFAGCEDEPVQRDYPRVKTLEVTNINSEGALFAAEVYESGSGEISDHGFAWALGQPVINYDNKVYLGPFIGTGQYTAEVRSTLAEGVTYKVTAFVRSGDYTVCGNTVEFKSLGSLGPEITGFSPARVLCGDTVLITGRRFSWVKGVNQVFFNATVANICGNVTDTTILAVVPFSLTAPEQTISVEVAGNRTTFTGGTLMVDLPVVEEISPASAQWGDTVEITIRNLRTQNNLTIQFGSINLLPVVPFDGQRVSFIVPWTVSSPENQLKVIVHGGEFTSQSPFILLPPVIERISPSHGVWSDNIMLIGTFNRLTENSTIRFGQHIAQMVYFTSDTIVVKVPDNLDITPADVVYSYRDLSSSPVPFSLDPPEIVSVTPMSGCVGTIVKIECKNLKYPFVSLWLNDVEIGLDALGGYSYDETYLECRIKGSFNGPAIFRVTVCGQSDTWAQPFMVRNPYIVSFTPHTAIPGDTITIVAEDFIDYYSSFCFDLYTPYDMPIVSRSDNVFKVIYPDCDHMTGPVFARCSNNWATSMIPSEDDLVQPQPVISSISPVTVMYNDEITVRGDNFSLIKEFNHLSVNGIEVNLTSCSRDELKFRMPLLPAGSCEIKLRVGGYEVTAGQQLICLSTWERLSDLPFNNNESFVMNFNGDVIVAASPDYQSTVIDRSLYRYDPATKRFNPLGSRISCIATYFGLVVKGDKAYISRFNGALPPVLDLFDRNTQSLTRVSDLPASGGYSYWLMDGDSILLAGLGTSHWKFNPVSAEWTRLGDLPDQTNQGHVFTINGRNFIITPQNRLFEYDAAEDRWVQKSWPAFSWYYHEHSETVVCNNKAYVCFGYVGSAQIAVYDPATDGWERVDGIAFPVPRENVLAFSLGEKLFLGGGNNYLDFWSFDTSLE